MSRLATILSILCTASCAGAAGPAFWDSPARVPFTDGELAGAGLDAGGSLVPGLVAETVLADSSLVLWSVVADGDEAVFAGSGHEGRLWRVDRRGAASLVADLPVEEIFSLVADGDGVLAGCGPGGQIFGVRGDGAVTPRGSVAGGYAWDLVRAADGTVYVAAGSPAAIYRLADDGGPELVVELPASNALDVAVRADGILLVSTQGPGRVFEIQPDRRRWSLVLAMEQDEGRQVLPGPDGWYALGYQDDTANGGDAAAGEVGRGGGPGGPEMGLGPFDIMVTADADVQPVRSALYWLDGPAPVRIWNSEQAITSVAWSEDHGWLGAGQRENGGSTVLYALVEPNDRRPLARWDGGDVLRLLVVGDASGPARVLAAQAHPGRLTRLRTPDADEATALGAPLDARTPSRWGRLAWSGAAGGQEPRFAVRTGMSPAPDESWTPWSDLGRGRDLDLGALAPARVLQWRVTLPAGSRVDAVTVSASVPNLAPAITHLELRPDGELFTGGMMQQNDNATQRFPDGLQVEYSVQSREDRRLDRDRATTLRPLRTLTWHAGDPTEDALVAQLLQRRQGEDAWLPIGGPTREQAQTWDTAVLPDGWYEVKLVVSDLPANPAALALTTERVLPAVPVDNTPPVVADWAVAPVPTGFTLRCAVQDAFGPLAGAEVELPDGSFERLDPRDGICDSAREEFAATVTYPQAWRETVPRPWSVRARFWDLQGNLASATGIVP